MKERPILFSAPMVRAILAGTKTQTWWAIKPEWWRCLDPEDEDDRATALEQCRYGAPGDRLWVKETWQTLDPYDSSDAIPKIPSNKMGAVLLAYWRRRARYRADFVPRYEAWERDVGPKEIERIERWRPSIHMPRWASRITLEITEVRIQRLHEITDEDAIAEGCPPRGPQPDGVGSQVFDPDSPIKAFERLWRSINGDSAWFDNPWVWALTFKRVQP